MPITVKCSSCDKEYQVRDSLAGKSVVCKECGAQVQVSRGLSRDPEDGDEPPVGGYSVAGGSDTGSNPSPSVKSRAAPAELVLVRNVSEFSSADRHASSARRQALAIYFGAGGVLLAIVAFVIKSVAPPPDPVRDAGQVILPPVNGTPPPVSRPVAVNQPQENPAARKKPAAKNGAKADGQTAGGNSEPKAAWSANAGESDAGESNASEFVIGHGGRAWNVAVDAPLEPFALDVRKKIYATIPKNSTGDVVLPDCPSPFVALGSNNSPREIREVRDVHANRRLGAVRGAALRNARPALSPDGQLFAAWPAGQNRIGVWNVKAEKPRGYIPVAGSPIPRLLIFAGNQRLIAVGGEDELFIWSMPEGILQGTIPLPKFTGPVVAGLSPGGRYLALAVGDSKEPFLRIFDLTTGKIAGEITLTGFADTVPVCHAVAFSPDGAELAALFDSSDESNLLAFQMDSGQLTTHVAIKGSLKTELNVRNWQGGRAVEWFPDRRRWLVFGQGVIDRAVGELVWTLPRDKSGAIQLGHVLDDERLLILGMEKQEAALVVHDVRSQ
jgi:hypothetical protein